jgi:hypothetical protein
LGIHLIHSRNKYGQFQSYYFESYDKLIEFNYDFPSDVIVYEADKNWSPHHLNKHPRLKKYSNLSARVGRRGEILFQNMAEQKGFIAQEIDQDPKKYKEFLRIMGEQVKRSDFIILNLPNVEVDVKCLSLQSDKEGNYYQLSYEEIQKYLKYSNNTGRRLVFAIYQRVSNKPVEGSLRMIDLSEINIVNIFIDSGGLKFIRLPIESLYEGFSLLKKYSIEKPSYHASKVIKNELTSNPVIDDKNVEQELCNGKEKVRRKISNLFKRLVNSVKGPAALSLIMILIFVAGMWTMDNYLLPLKFNLSALLIDIFLGSMVLKIVIKVSEYGLFIPISCVLMGAVFSSYTSLFIHYGIFPKLYYLIFMLFGLLGCFNYGINKLNKLSKTS